MPTREKIKKNTITSQRNSKNGALKGKTVKKQKIETLGGFPSEWANQIKKEEDTSV